jgi:DNA-binding response OmpR family regulator
MLAVDYLEEAGIKVDTASSAAEALNKLRLIPGGVDAVILDMGLPDRQGDALTEELRSLYPSLPIVIATGRDRQDVKALFANRSRVAFVTKPYTSEDLRASLRSFGIAC